MESFTVAVVMCFAQIIMTFRIYAMSGQNKLLLYSLLGFSVLQCILGLVMTATLGNEGDWDFTMALCRTDCVQVEGLYIPPISLSAYRRMLKPPTYLIGFFNKLFPVCFLYPDNATGTLAFAFIFLSLAFDTILFSLTLLYTSRALRSYTPSHLLRSLQRDGVFYFFFVLCANVCWMSFIQHARASARPHKLEAILTKRYLFSLHWNIF